MSSGLSLKNYYLNTEMEKEKLEKELEFLKESFESEVISEEEYISGKERIEKHLNELKNKEQESEERKEYAEGIAEEKKIEAAKKTEKKKKIKKNTKKEKEEFEEKPEEAAEEEKEIEKEEIEEETKAEEEKYEEKPEREFEEEDIEKTSKKYEEFIKAKGYDIHTAVRNTLTNLAKERKTGEFTIAYNALEDPEGLDKKYTKEAA